MKKVYLMLSCLVLAFSCEDVEQINGKLTSTEWLQFENATDQVSENDTEPLLVPVIYAAATNDTDIDVSFTYTATDTQGYTVEPANGIVTIPAGEFVGYITVTPIDDIIVGENVVLDFTIEANTDFNLGIAGDGVYNVNSIVTIIEDDCPIDIVADWEGTYSGTEVFTDSGDPDVSPNAGLSITSGFTATLTANTADPTGTSAIWTIGGGYLVNGEPMSFTTCSEEVVFSGNPIQVAGQYDFTIESANFNASSFSITCTGQLQTFGEYTFTLTKN
ncbi:hypothetical protein [Lacinutrix undariae]